MPPTLEPYEQILIGAAFIVLLPAAVFYMLGYFVLGTGLYHCLPKRWAPRIDRWTTRAGTVTFLTVTALIAIAIAIAIRIIAVNLITPNLPH